MGGPTGRVLGSDAPEGHIHFLIIPLFPAIDFWMEANGEEACQGPEQPAEFHPEPGGSNLIYILWQKTGGVKVRSC